MRLITLIRMAGLLATASSLRMDPPKIPANVKQRGTIVSHKGPRTDGLPNGFGTAHYDSGEIFQGHFLSGTPDGFCKLNSNEGKFKNSNMTQVCTQHIPVGAQHAIVFTNGCSFPEIGVNPHVNGGPNASIAPYMTRNKYCSFDKLILLMAIVFIIAITKQKRIKCLLLELKKTIDDIQRQKRIIDEFNLQNGQGCCLRYENSHCFLEVFKNCKIHGLLIPRNVINKALSEGIPINSSAPFPSVDQLEKIIIHKISSSKSFKYWVLHQIFVPEDQHELFTVSIQGPGVWLKLAQNVDPDDPLGVITLGDQPI
ncbi:MAG: hypothetical protein ISQ13_00840 [Candidatus Margulisbacteria bacterium]|nr:hypothetical protein [Candidatus Margulisiibacteriota bacterium]